MSPSTLVISPSIAISNSAIRQLERLMSDAVARKESCQLLLSGHHIVSEYSGPITNLYATERYIQKHREPKGSFHLLSEEVIQRITKEGRPEGILALIPRPHNTYTDTALHPRTLVLWGLTDPRNIGSLARTALALQWTQLVLFGRADPFHPEAIRCSKGALLRFPRIVQTEDPNVLMDPKTKLYLAEKAHPDTETNGNTRTCTDRIALVIGSESHGFKDLPPALRTASSSISIDTSAEMPFLSVSAAGAILMHKLAHRKIDLCF